MRVLGISFLVLHVILIIVTDATQPKNQKLPKKPQTGNKLRDAIKMLNLDTTSFIRIKTKRNESNCDRDIAAWLNDLKTRQPWAIDFFDSQAKLQSSLFQGNRINIGNFDGCLNITSPYNFTGQYCLLSINTTKTDWLPNDVPVHTVTRYPMASLGICVPSSCPKEYVERVIQNLDFPLLKTNLSNVFQIRIDDGNCHKLTDESQLSTLNWFTIVVLCSIVAVSVFSTCYEILRKNPESESILSPFSLIDNAKEIFAKSDQKNASIMGFRALHTFLIVLVHISAAQVHGNLQNATHGFVFARRDKLSLFIQMIGKVVEAFFTLAGALTVIKFMKTVQSRGEYDPVWEVIQRHIRFTTPVAVILLIRIGISEHLHVGPIYTLLNEFNRKNCRTSVFAILFGYDNFNHLLHNTVPRCFPQLWQSSVDIQLFAFSQIILIAAFWNKHAIWVLSLTFCAITTVTAFLVGYIYDLGPTLTVTRSQYTLTHDYLMPHTRGAPWFAGMFLGYLLVNFKNRPNKKITAIMWILALFSFSFVYFAVGWFDYMDYQQPAAALYLSGHRVLLAIGYSWIIYILFLNISGPIGKILSWGLFDFYGKISLEMYILHLPLIQFVMASARETVYVTVERSLYDFFPIMFYLTILAVILAIFVTIPCNKLLQKYGKHVKIWPIRVTSHNQDKKDR